MKSHPVAENRSSMAALILAGGLGTRMGGEQKGLLRWRSKTFIEHIVAQLTPQLEHIYLNVNTDQSAYAKFGLPIIADNDFQGAGPLAGLYAGLQQVPFEYLLTVPCDTPVLPPDLVKQLLTAAATHNRLAVASCNHQLQPTFALVHKNYRSSLFDYLQSARRKTQTWFIENEAILVNFPTEYFVNINTTEDLSELN